MGKLVKIQHAPATVIGEPVFVTGYYKFSEDEKEQNIPRVRLPSLF